MYTYTKMHTYLNTYTQEYIHMHKHTHKHRHSDCINEQQYVFIAGKYTFPRKCIFAGVSVQSGQVYTNTGALLLAIYIIINNNYVLCNIHGISVLTKFYGNYKYVQVTKIYILVKI